MKDKLYKLMNWPAIEEIIYSEADHPENLLGPHAVGKQTLIQAYCPGAVKGTIEFESNVLPSVKMELADEDGYFAALISTPVAELPLYHYVFEDEEKNTYKRGESYRLPVSISEDDLKKFRFGIHYTVYEKLGAHPCSKKGISGVSFAVWAPNAMRVSVVGDFNRWDGRIHQMTRLQDSGIFALFIPDAAVGANYKFEIKLKNGLTYLKADPYANAAQLRPETASVITDLSGFMWEDGEFIANREKYQGDNSPISVYEMYLGSFTAKDDNGNVNYRMIAQKLIPYLQEMGYTHVELMPIMEHPLDESWGYQVTGYYAPTARYGSPLDFMYFVNELHKAGLGVILDWVPAHFPRDIYGLASFDGTCLYEHLDPRQGCHPQWGTLIYNYGRKEVSNFLIANALFWVEMYHVDGLRFDAVASMLYLDYARNDGEWIPNIYGGNENLEAIEMMKHLNSIIHKRNKGVLTIAEDRTAYPGVTASLEDGGLGFDYKWNMGFMNDYLGYIRNDPIYRKYHHNELTFPMIYAYSENYILPFSHDEAVHGKATMLGKMPGEREQQFANLRLSYAYQYMHPGKKLLFMGQDIGEYDEWNEKRCVEWYLKAFPEHAGIAELIKDLNFLYRKYPCFTELDRSPDGFQWLEHMAANESYVAFARKDAAGEMMIAVANFSGVEIEIPIGVPAAGKYKEILNTDNVKYGGTGIVNPRMKRSKAAEVNYFEQSITIKLAPLSLSVLQYTSFAENEKQDIPKQTNSKKRGK